MVIGTKEEDVRNKILVVNTLIESPSSVLSRKDDLTFRPIYSDAIHASNWQIDTKYYTADVEFWVVDQPNYPPTQIPLNVERLGELCEALILVFDATKNDTFDKLGAWSQFVEEYNPNVLLCVGIGKSENRVVYNEWCVDNGLEYVEISEPTTTTTAEPTTSELSTDKHNEGDDEEEEEDDRFGGTEGKDRIIEALGTTMWVNMKQKARRIEDQFSSMLNLGDSDSDLEADSPQQLQQQQQQLQPPPTFDPFNFEEDLRLAQGEFRHATDEISQNLRSLQSLLRETEIAEEERNNESAELDTSIETNVEQFENALTGLRRLRENAQQLPDAQRKALAAHVITMLFPDEEDWK